jgi:hypothetical protein
MDRKSIASQVREKKKTTLKWYCEMNNLSYYSIVKGFISRKTRRILEKDGIKVA